jgi:hypothetical protein
MDKVVEILKRHYVAVTFQEGVWYAQSEYTLNGVLHTERVVVTPSVGWAFRFLNY